MKRYYLIQVRATGAKHWLDHPDVLEFPDLSQAIACLKALPKNRRYRYRLIYRSEQVIM